MLRITIEVFPGGSVHRRRTIATADVANISGLADVSDYAVAVETKGCLDPWLPAWERKGMITRHDRRQTVWALVAKVAAWAAAEAEKT